MLEKRLFDNVVEFMNEQGFDINAEALLSKSRGFGTGKQYLPEGYRLTFKLYIALADEKNFVFRIIANMLNKSIATIAKYVKSIRSDDDKDKEKVEVLLEKYRKYKSQ